MTTKDSKMSTKLDYNVEDVDGRMGVVNHIIQENDESLVDYQDNRYNPNIGQSQALSEDLPMSRDLEKMADYLLYMDDKEKRDGQNDEDTVLTKNNKQNSKKKEFMTDDLGIVEGSIDTSKPTTNTKKYPSIKVTKKDREEYPELREYGLGIEALKKMIESGQDSQGNEVSKERLKKARWMLIELRKDEVAVKDRLKGYIRFVRLSNHEPNKDLSMFSFADINQVKAVFDNYASLKEDSYEDTHGDVRAIIDVFEEMADATDFEDWMFDIFVLKIDKLSNKDIIAYLEEKHGIVMSEPRLSQIVTWDIPKAIRETYLQSKMEWLHLNVIRGEYKTCTRCGETKLTNEFGKYSRNKDGLRNICKNCR